MAVTSYAPSANLNGVLGITVTSPVAGLYRAPTGGGGHVGRLTGASFGRGGGRLTGARFGRGGRLTGRNSGRSVVTSSLPVLYDAAPGFNDTVRIGA